MLNSCLVIARKETKDSLRDFRSVLSSLLFAFMGPLVVGVIAFAPEIKRTPQSPLPSLISVFILVAAFTGGMNVAMDTVAGERERRSMLPLLLNPVARWQIAVGKWLVVCLFSIGGLALNVAAFAGVFVGSGLQSTAPHFLVALVIGVFPLPLLAASFQLLLSSACRTVKEAQTYLSMAVFLPMSAGMFVVFFPAVRQPWSSFIPVLGQQLQLQRLMNGGEVPLLQSLILGGLTCAVALFLLLVPARQLQRDENIYGN